MVYGEQKMIKRCCFDPTHFTNDLHDLVYSNQERLKLYNFMKTAVTDSDFDDPEDSYSKNSDACMNNMHSLDIDSPDSFLSDLMNDDCMKLNPEEATVLNLLNYNASQSDAFYLCLSSF